MPVLLRQDNTVDTDLHRVPTSGSLYSKVNVAKLGAGIGNMSLNTITWAFNEIDVPFTDTSISIYNRVILDAASVTRVNNNSPIFTRI